MNKKIIIGGLVLIIVSFYGGVKYNQSQTPILTTRGIGGYAGTGGRGGRVGGGIVNGDILSKDTTSITVKMRDGSGSKIVLVSPSTAVMKAVLGSQNDLLVGEQITVIGTANSDGSVTSTSIQIRPASTTSIR